MMVLMQGIPWAGNPLEGTVTRRNSPSSSAEHAHRDTHMYTCTLSGFQEGSGVAEWPLAHVITSWLKDQLAQEALKHSDGQA